jgi:energy-coupling factor transporter ATP-binding protein EcfA2
MITEWSLSEHIAEENGLKPFKLERLGRIVVLVGPNGAGKSRILQRLRSLIADYSADFSRLLSNSPHSRQAVLLETARRIGKGVKGPPAKLPDLLTEAMSNPGKPENAEFLARARELVPWATVGTAGIVQLQRPRTDQTVRTPESVLAGQIGVLPKINLDPSQGWENMELHYNALAHHAHFYMSDIDENVTVESRAAALRRLKDLQDALRKATQAEVTSDTTKQQVRPPLFNGKRIAEARFSEGQKVLVSWLTTLHATQQDVREDQIVLIDEPELHLHPQVSVEVIAGLEKHLGSHSQIFLATHSVSLALGLQATYGDKCSLVYVDKGHAQYASNRLDKVAEGLLGGKDARLAMRDLLADADEIEFFRFAADSLAPATVASHSEGDPQNEQAVAILSGRVLDYAPGRGRLATQLAQGNRKDIEYYAFIPPQHSEHRAECVRAIQALYPSENPELRIFADKSAARTRFGDGFSWILLCNVLHEIPIDEWKQTFDRIHSMLSDGGRLLLLEDQQLAKGELPHKGGFVVLAPDEVRDLFDTKSNESIKVLEVRHNERLTAISIAKECLNGCCAETVKAALEHVVDHASEKMDTISSQGHTDARAGRRFAFYALQYTNASRYLKKQRPRRAASAERRED